MMQIGEYIERLKVTKTFRDRLITIQGYNYTKRFGILVIPPQLPTADLDKHHIVLKIRGGQPHIVGTITDRGSTYEPSSQDDGNLLFVTVQMKPQLMRIVSPTNGYQLGDGHHIDTEFRVRYRVQDAELLWHASDDPLAEFELKVIERAKEYFLSIKSNFLISSPYDLKHMLQEQLQDSELKLVKDNVQVSIKKVHVDGIELLDVNADVHLSQTLRRHLQGIHDRIYGSGGFIDRVNEGKLDSAFRKHIDERIDQDSTFPGYSLRQIILAVDTGLLENFYTENWSTAMSKLHVGIAKIKSEVLRRQDEQEVERLEKHLQRVIRMNLPKMETDMIRSAIAEKMLAMVNAEQDTQTYSNERFFAALIGPPSDSQRQLHSKSSQQFLADTTKESVVNLKNLASNLPYHDKLHIERFTDIRFPSHCIFNKPSILSVQIKLNSVDAEFQMGTPDISTPVQLDIWPEKNEWQNDMVRLVVMVSAEHFRISNTWLPIAVPLETDSERIEFELVGQIVGEQIIEVEFFHQSTRVGYVVVSTNVMHDHTPSAK